jgi:peptidoglycan/LPS O-acetylase OafA/YrhL
VVYLLESQFQRIKILISQRRIQRIYPVYLASVVLELVLMPQALNFQFFLVLLLNLVFLNQVFTNTSFVGPLWTLATEVWLYSLAPFFLKLSLRSIFIIIYISFTCYCIYTCGRSLYHWNYYSGTRYGINLILLAYIWLAGFALAIFTLSKKFVAINIAIIFIVYLGLLIMIQCGFRYKHHELSQIVPKDLPGFIGKILCLSWVYFVVIYNHKIPHFSLSVHKIFNLLGNISYPLYLIHETLFNFLRRFQINNLFVLIAIALSSSFIIYWLFDFYSKKRVIK